MVMKDCGDVNGEMMVIGDGDGTFLVCVLLCVLKTSAWESFHPFESVSSKIFQFGQLDRRESETEHGHKHPPGRSYGHTPCSNRMNIIL